MSGDRHVMDGATASVCIGTYNNVKVSIKTFKETISTEEVENEAMMVSSIIPKEYFQTFVGVLLVPKPRSIVTTYFGETKMPARSTLSYHQS